MSLEHVVAGVFKPIAFESITVAAAAIGFTSGSWNPSTGHANRAVVTVETASVRYRYDGSDPTAAEGHLLNAGDVLIVVGYDALSATKFIRTSSSATLKVTYER